MKKKTFVGKLDLKLLQVGAFVAILFLGLVLRFSDLLDPPLDFHPMRQLRSAILARNFYFQLLPNNDSDLDQRGQEMTYIIEPQEPPIFEGLVALTYLITGEHLWVARIYSILFWLVSAICFFLLAQRIVSFRGALFTLAYFMLLPFSVIVSRVFQPEPFMMMWLSITLLIAFFWAERRTWKWAFITGVLAGWTVLVKITAVYFLAPALVAIVLCNWSFRKVFSDKGVWLAAGLTAVLPAVYYFGVIGKEALGWFSGWGLSFTGLLLQPRFYITWIKFLDYLLDLTLVGIGLIGLVLVPRVRDKLFLASLWVGYVLFGLSFPYPIRTHEYYSMMLIPIVGLSLASVGNLAVDALIKQSRIWRWFALLVTLFFIAYPSWLTYTGLVGTNYDHELIAWQKMGQELPEGKIIGLTHDYGYRIAYYGMRLVTVWPSTADFAMLSQRNEGFAVDFDAMFKERTAGMDFFLVTLPGELDAQPQLKETLYGKYSVFAQGDGYTLFDLRNPIEVK